MNFDRIIAESFLAELKAISQDSANDGDKVAAISLYNAMDVEHVEALVKEAGFGDLVRGVGTGLKRMGAGALQGIKQTGMNLAAKGSEGLTNMGLKAQGAMTRASDRMAGGFFKPPTAATGPTGTGSAVQGRVGQSVTQATPRQAVTPTVGAPSGMPKPSQAQLHQQRLMEDRQSFSGAAPVDPTMTMTTPQGGAAGPSLLSRGLDAIHPGAGGGGSTYGSGGPSVTPPASGVFPIHGAGPAASAAGAGAPEPTQAMSMADTQKTMAASAAASAVKPRLDGPDPTQVMRPSPQVRAETIRPTTSPAVAAAPAQGARVGGMGFKQRGGFIGVGRAA